MKKMKAINLILIFLLIAFLLPPIMIKTVEATEEYRAKLWVNFFSDDVMDFNIDLGTWPYLSEVSGKIYAKTDPAWATYFTFENLPQLSNFTLINASLCIYIQFDDNDLDLRPSLWNGSYFQVADFSSTTAIPQWFNVTVTDVLSDLSSVNDVRLKIYFYPGLIGYYVYVFKALIDVFFTAKPISIVVKVDGETPKETLYAVKINSQKYKDGDTVYLESGNYSLSVATINYDFINWTTANYISVLNNQSKSTILTVEGTGTLTLHLRPIFLDWFMARTLMWLGLIGIFICMLCPVMAFTKIKSKDLEGGAMWFLGVLILGIPFIVAWLWG